MNRGATLVKVGAGCGLSRSASQSRGERNHKLDADQCLNMGAHRSFATETRDLTTLAGAGGTRRKLRPIFRGGTIYVSAAFSPAAADVHGWTSGNTPSAATRETASPESHRTTSGSPASSIVPLAPRTDTWLARRTGCPVPSLSAFPTPISSILVRTNSARLRLSWGGIGGYLVNKFVKQTKIDSWLAHERGFDQVGLVEAEPDEGAGRARILWEADPTVGQKEPRLDPLDRVRHRRTSGIVRGEVDRTASRQRRSEPRFRAQRGGQVADCQQRYHLPHTEQFSRRIFGASLPLL
jgi:hypothetical protein